MRNQISSIWESVWESRRTFSLAVVALVMGSVIAFSVETSFRVNRVQNRELSDRVHNITILCSAISTLQNTLVNYAKKVEEESRDSLPPLMFGGPNCASLIHKAKSVK